jgi:hypothetical protein
MKINLLCPKGHENKKNYYVRNEKNANNENEIPRVLKISLRTVFCHKSNLSQLDGIEDKQESHKSYQLLITIFLFIFVAALKYVPSGEVSLINHLFCK